MICLIIQVCLYAYLLAFTQAKPELSQDKCRQVRDTAMRLNNASRTLIYRCRPGDDCGGTGDRLGGVMGGAFYAILTGRSFRMHWPGLDVLFSPGFTNWTFDSKHLGVHYLDSDGKEINRHRISSISKKRGSFGDIYAEFENSTDVGVVNDINARQISDGKHDAQIGVFTHVFFHSNRGPTKRMYQSIVRKYDWNLTNENVEISYLEAYRCVFQGLFQPTDTFLGDPYKPMGSTAIPFRDIINIVADPDVISLSFHYRVNDIAAEKDKLALEAIDQPLEKRIRSLGHLALSQHSNATKVNLFFISNSNASAYRIFNSTKLTDVYQHVYVQELHGVKHINANRRAVRLNISRSELNTLEQSWRDWWIMHLSDVIVCPLSGFSRSAAMTAPLSQIKYDSYWTQTPLSIANTYNMCGNKLC
mmetsp:Transcript_2471/g.3868  ORF Transcript_2471/g.3868 Transcript_2471/m.3868 type:complete len:418 (-) Transcript_2471:55-1308(-)